MGNIQSEEDIERLTKKHDALSGEYDIILTYVINHLVMRHLVSDIAQKCQKEFKQGALGKVLDLLKNLKDESGLLKPVPDSSAKGTNLNVDQEGLVKHVTDCIEDGSGHNNGKGGSAKQTTGSIEDGSHLDGDKGELVKQFEDSIDDGSSLTNDKGGLVKQPTGSIEDGSSLNDNKEGLVKQATDSIKDGSNLDDEKEGLVKQAANRTGGSNLNDKKEESVKQGNRDVEDGSNLDDEKKGLVKQASKRIENGSNSIDVKEVLVKQATDSIKDGSNLNDNKEGLEKQAANNIEGGSNLNDKKEGSVKQANRDIEDGTNLDDDQMGLVKLVTGSSAEGLNLPQVYRISDSGLIEAESSDYDMLWIDTLVVANNLGQAIEMEESLFLGASHSYPGFSRVRVSENLRINDKFMVKRFQNGKEIQYLSKSMIEQLRQARGPSFKSGPAITEETSTNMKVHSLNVDFLKAVLGESSIDLVYAINVAEWPQFMKKWKERQATPTVLDSIIDNNIGCFLVGAAHPQSTDPDIEWRISCSVPELILAQELSVIQRQVYMAFKYLVKETVKGLKGIVTYHLKTTLFWTVEKSPKEIWCEDNLAECLYLLLDNFILFLAQKRLPNYFIPESNLFEHLSSDHIKTTSLAIIKLREDPLGHLLRYQRCLRLEGHTLQWNNTLQDILIPHIKSASEILSNKKEHPKSAVMILRQILFDSMIDVTATRLSEGGYEDACSMMMYYISLPGVLKCGKCELPQEEQMYNFLRCLCQTSYLKRENPDVSFSLLRHIQLYVDKMEICTEVTIARITLLEFHWNLQVAKNATDHEESENRWDQCACIIDAFNPEDDDIVVMTEFSCFFFQLWSRRYKDNADCTQVMATQKAMKTLSNFSRFLQKDQQENAYQFYGIWRLLHWKFDEIEPNLTYFLKSCVTCYVPHEILALAVLIWSITAITIPSAVNYIIFIKTECDCQMNEAEGEAYEHTSRIGRVQKLLEMADDIASQSFKGLCGLVAIFVERIKDLDFEVPGLRTTSEACVTFLFALTLMYTRNWKGAMDISFSGLPDAPPSLQGVMTKYCHMCLFMVTFEEYKKSAKGSASNSANKPMEGKSKTGNSASRRHERHTPKSMYNRDVDMSTYGVKQLKRDPWNENIHMNLPTMDAEVWIQGAEVTIYDHPTSICTSYPFDGTYDDMNKIFQQHFFNRKSDQIVG